MPSWMNFFRRDVLGLKSLRQRDQIRGPRGTVRVGYVRPDGRFDVVVEKQNTIMLQWGHIAARQIGFRRDIDQLDYAIKGMYIEFENVAAPGNAVTIPSYDRLDGLEYYEAMSGSTVRDFLRVGLQSQPTLGISAGYESYYTEGVSGNKLSFFAQTSGTVGVHGRTFSDGVNSKVFGMALVARPVFEDRTRDVILARTYVDVADQTLKDASSQVGVSWDIDFL